MASNDLSEHLANKVLRPLVDAFKEPLEVSDDAIRIIAADLSEWLRNRDRDDRITIRKRQLLVIASATEDSLEVLLFNPEFQTDAPDLGSLSALLGSKQSGLSVLPPDPNYSRLQLPLSEILEIE